MPIVIKRLLGTISRTDCLALAVLFTTCSICAGLAFQIPFTLYYASTDYFVFANNYLTSSPSIDTQNTANIRTIGYPLFLAFLSAGSLDLEVLAWWQVIIGGFLPIIGFLALRKVFGTFDSLLIALPVCLSFVFLASSRTFLNEQLYSMALWGFAISTLIYFQVPSRKYLTLVIALWLLASLTRPIAFPLIVMVAFLAPAQSLPQRYFRVAAALAIFATAYFANGKLHQMIVPDYTSGTGILAAIQPIVGSQANLDWRFSEDDGPATQRLLQIVHEFETTEKGKAAIEAFHKKKRLNPSDPRATCPAISSSDELCFLSTPTLESYWQIKWAVIRALGIVRADALFMDVIAEQAKAKPDLLFTYWSHGTWNFLNGGNTHYSYSPNSQYTLVPKNMFRIAHTNQSYVDRYSKFFRPSMPQSLNKINAETNTSIIGEINSFIFPLWSTTFALNIGFVFLAAAMIVKFSFTVTPSINIYTSGILIGTAFFICHALVVPLIHPPLGRYVYPLLPVTLLAYSSAIILALKFLRARYDTFKKPSN